MKFAKNNFNTFPLHIMAIAFSLVSSTAAQADWGIGLAVDNERMKYEDESSDIKLQGLFNLQYEGDKLNLGKDGLTYELIGNDQYAVELLAASKQNGFDDDDDNKILKGMDERDPSIDLGGRVIVETGFAGKVVIDVTKDAHSSKGINASIKFGGIAPHASHWTGEKKVNVAAVGGVRYQDKKSVDYYYGVKDSETTAKRGAYKGKAATTPFIGFEVQANLTKHITIDGGLDIAKTATSVKNSPLTDDNKYGVGGNVGVTYWF